MYLKVEGETLVRDTRSNAILETDKEKLMKHRAQQAMQAKIRDREDKIDFLIERINKLEQQIERMTNGNVNT